MRPAVSVVVPFGGDRAGVARLADALAQLVLSDEDEMVVVDNTVAQLLRDDEARFPPQTRVVPATDERSSYFARNVGALAARHDWLLFIDADTRPTPRLLDAFLARPPADDVGAIAGPVTVLTAPDEGFVARYQASRQPDMQQQGDPHRPTAVTANLMVRRRAWLEVGGFHEGIRSAGDHDFVWRLQESGWSLASAPQAEVRHYQRTTLRALLRLHARYGAGRRWLHIRHVEARRRGRLSQFARPVARSLQRSAQAALALRARDAAYFALDAAVISSEALGYSRTNQTPQPRLSRLQVLLVVDRFPELSETFIVGEAHELANRGVPAAVFSIGRATRPTPGGAHGVDVTYAEDAGILRKLADLGWLATRHPEAVLRDLAAQRRWRREEPIVPLRVLASPARRIAAAGGPHIHAHFASQAALCAMRLSRLTGVPWSLTVHGYDVYKTPANLAEKARAARFVTAPCAAMAADVRELVPGTTVHERIMGVDPDAFRRRRAERPDAFVLAVGRLVEKKGFAVLAEAAKSLSGVRIVVVGAGPLRDELAATHALELTGSAEPVVVRDLLAEAAVVVVPSVVAADGDRDSMPVIAKEALAMEVPVVASDIAGLREVVRPAWGQLVPPGDASALAAALQTAIALDGEERARMGAAGRAFVVEHCSLAGQVDRLLTLIDQS